jgi:hypothetical protein
MIVEKLMECTLAGETEVPGENLPQRHFCPSQNPTLPDPGMNPGRRGGKSNLETQRFLCDRNYIFTYLDDIHSCTGRYSNPVPQRQ